MADPERTRLVVLGDAGVGKSAICKRFLYNSFCSKYKMTVEDLYSKEFNVGTPHQLKVSHLLIVYTICQSVNRRLKKCTVGI